MNKNLGYLFIVIGFIALLGSVFFAYFLVNFASFASQLQTNIQNIPALQGLNPVIIQNLTSTIKDVNNYVGILFIWVLTLLVSSLTAMYYGLNLLKKK